MCKKGDYQLIRHIKEEHNKAREGFKRRVHQHLVNNNINDFNKDIVLTTTSGNFFYDDYGVKHFMTLNGPIPIETAKNIVMFINNNAFVHGLTSSMETSSTEPSGIEPSTARSNDKSKSTTYFCNDDNNDVNIENLTVDIDFLDCHFDDNGQDYRCLVVSPSTYFPLQSATAL